MTNIIYESCHHLLVIFLLGPIKWGPKSGGGGNHDGTTPVPVDSAEILPQTSRLSSFRDFYIY